MASLTKECVTFAYPCSVEGGVDGEEYCLLLYRKNLTDALCRALDWDRSQLEGKNEDDVKRRAKELNETKWRHTRQEDKTSMTGDFSEVEKSLEVCNLHNRPESQVVSEFGNECIANIRGRLTYVYNANNLFVHPLTVLCIIGHGLPEDVAEIIQDTGVWRWKMYNCDEKNGIDKTEENVKQNAAKGDIVVFSSGFLSPNWVVERLREHDEKGVQSGIESTVILIIDSCFSGVWTLNMSESLRGVSLKKTRVIVQTSCSENELSYGGVFWPTFRALQENDRFPPMDASMPSLQTPTFFDSSGSQNSATPYAEVDIGGTRMRFFKDGDFFKAVSEDCRRRGHRAGRSRSAVMQELTGYI